MKNIMKRIVLGALVIGTGAQAQEVPAVPDQPSAVGTIVSNLASATGNILYFGCSSILAALGSTLKVSELASSGIKTATEYPKTLLVSGMVGSLIGWYCAKQMDNAQKAVLHAEQMIDDYLNKENPDIVKKLVRYYEWNARTITISSTNLINFLKENRLNKKPQTYGEFQSSLQNSLKQVQDELNRLNPYTNAQVVINSLLKNHGVAGLKDLLSGIYDEFDRQITNYYNDSYLNMTRIVHLLNAKYSHKAGALYWRLFQIREALHAINIIVEANKDALENVQ